MATAQVRAERRGNGNGRVYTVYFTATDGHGGSTPSSVKVRVPKNANNNAIDEGALFNSFLCP
jgi:hypothetical protein